MNKFRKGLLTACLTATFLGGLVSCNQPSAELTQAQSFLYQAYKDELVNTGDYKMPSKLIMNGVTYPVSWSVNVTEGNKDNVKVGTEVDEKGYITIDVAYAPYATNDAATKYTLTATITDAEGKTITQDFSKEIPAFQFTTHKQYLNAAAGDMVNVEGYVVAKTTRGDDGYVKNVFLQTANGEGYYVYGLKNVSAEDYATEFAIGSYVVISGAKDIYSGTAEIVSATYQKSNIADVEVTPYDITTLFDGAESVTDKTLINLQGSLVTVKDVILTTYTESNGYLNWTKGGKDSYVRISSSGNPSDHDSTAKETLIANYPSKFGYKADVTGIVTQFNGNFYLMPTSKDSIKVTSTAADPEFAFNYAVKQLSVDAEIFSNLPTTVEGTGTTITWASTAEGVVAENGKVTLKTEPVTTTLTATITLGEKTETKVFENVVVKLPEVSQISALKADMNKLTGKETTDFYVIEGVIVAKDGSGRPYVMDANGDVVLVYNNSVADLKNAPVGTTVKLAGVGSVYNGLHQFASSGSFTVLSVGTTTSEVVYGNATTIAAADYTKAVLTDKEAGMNGKYVKLTGVELRKNGNYFNLYYTPANGTETQIQLQSNGMNETLAALDGKEVVVYGYSYGCNSTTARITAVKVVDAANDVVVTPSETKQDTLVTDKTKDYITPAMQETDFAERLGLDPTIFSVKFVANDCVNKDGIARFNDDQLRLYGGNYQGTAA